MGEGQPELSSKLERRKGVSVCFLWSLPVSSSAGGQAASAWPSLFLSPSSLFSFAGAVIDTIIGV